jgi:hypothetical protein
MRALYVAPRNAGASAAALARTLTRALLLGALACGAEATSGGSDPVESTSEAASASVAALQPNPAGADEQATAGSEAAPTAPSQDEAGSDPLLAAPSLPPIENPPSAPAPLPTTELVTSRPVNAPPMDVAINDCRFEYLGDWIRCENAGRPNLVETDAPDLASCMQRCLERDDCTAVTDYLWLGLPGIACYLYLSTCDSPAFVAWGEEDSGHDFRRTCSSETDDWLPIDAAAPAADAP